MKHNRCFVILVGLSCLMLPFGATGLAGCQAQKPTPKPTAATPPGEVVLSSEAMQVSRIHTTPVRFVQAAVAWSTYAQVLENADRVVEIHAPVAGQLVVDAVRLGDVVRAGQPLARLRNEAVAEIHGRYIHDLHQNEIEIRQARVRQRLAQETLSRERRLFAEGISSRKELQQADAQLALVDSELAGLKEHRTHIRSEAQALLEAYGSSLPPDQSEKVTNESPIRSPLAGVVIDKQVSLGQRVSPENILYRIADLSTVWLDLAVYPKDLSLLKTGQSVSFQPDAYPGSVFEGRIHYLRPKAQSDSQTFLARVFLENPGGRLKPGMVGQASVQQARPERRLVVPKAAVQNDGAQHVVFVELAPGRYRKRSVELGAEIAEGDAVVTSGLSEGERVVDVGAFTLKSVLEKSRLPEGE
jgi:cobalt-zinc-cadmium efflux system membrane fusion protein